MLRQVLLVGVMFAALWQPCAAQTPSKPGDPVPISPGDGRISGSRLRPYTNAWVLSARYKDGHTEELGVWSDILRMRTVEGRKLYVRAQGMTYWNGKTSSAINMFDPETLAPVASINVAPDGKSIARKFDGVHVQSTLVGAAGAAPALNKFDAPGPVFDFNGGMYGLLLAAQSLHAGDAGTIPSLDEFTDDYKPVRFKVTGRERIRAGAKGDVDCWVVEVEDGSSAPYKFWISDDAPYIIKLESPSPRGALIWQEID